MSTINNSIQTRATIDGPSPLAINLLSAFLALLVFTLLLVSIHFIVRRRRHAQEKASFALPIHKLDLDISLSSSPTLQLDRPQTPPIPTRSRHRRTPSTLHIPVMGPTPPAVTVYEEKHGLCESTPSPPSSPIPEIRITFPDEIDGNGRRQSGRVVVVRIGENTEGLEPLDEELPGYQREVTERFEEVNLDTVGGLKEK